MANRLRQVTLAGPRRPEKEGVLALADEARGGQFEDQGAIHLLVEITIEAVQAQEADEERLKSTAVK